MLSYSKKCTSHYRASRIIEKYSQIEIIFYWLERTLFWGWSIFIPEKTKTSKITKMYLTYCQNLRNAIEIVKMTKIFSKLLISQKYSLKSFEMTKEVSKMIKLHLKILKWLKYFQNLQNNLETSKWPKCLQNLQ